MLDAANLGRCVYLKISVLCHIIEQGYLAYSFPSIPKKMFVWGPCLTFLSSEKLASYTEAER